MDNIDMEKERAELLKLKESIYHLDKCVSCFVDCDTVTKEEYRKIANYLEILKERKNELEIYINGCILEEV